MNSSNHFFKIITLGCPLNQSESDIIARQLSESGLNKSDNKADVYIINSCIVTQNAASKSRKVAKKAKKENPEALVYLMGCYGEIEGHNLKDDVPEIDGIVGTSDRQQIITHILNKFDMIDASMINIDNKERYVHSLNKSHYYDYNPDKMRPAVKVQEGCNQNCSYCLVTIARGAPKSRAYEDIKCEIESYLNRGYKEIVLAGTNMGLYGQDLEGNWNLVKLLDNLANLPFDHYRLRLSSLEPMELDFEVLNVIAENDKICNYLYIPLQSGSDRVLQLMNRNYKTEQFAQLVEESKKLISDIGVMTDIIAGFPDETEEDHQRTKDFISELGLSKIHVFSFSPRPKTAAKQMSNQVRPDLKKVRTEELKTIGKQLASNFNKYFISENLSILVEKIKFNSVEGFYIAEGFSENYIFAQSYLGFSAAIENLSKKNGFFIDVIPQAADSKGVTAVWNI